MHSDPSQACLSRRLGELESFGARLLVLAMPGRPSVSNVLVPTGRHVPTCFAARSERLRALVESVDPRAGAQSLSGDRA